MTKHAIRRARERYDLLLSFDDIAEIVERIQGHDARPVMYKKVSNVYKLTLHNQLLTTGKFIRRRTVWVVYVSDPPTVVTFLPRPKQSKTEKEKQEYFNSEEYYNHRYKQKREENKTYKRIDRDGKRKRHY